MSDNIKIDIPQLIVLPQKNYRGIAKEFIEYIKESFLWSYLSQKFSEYSVRHAIMNEQIRKLFFAHLDSVETRTKNDFYFMNANHYTILFLGGAVSKGISCIAAEMLYTIYFMKFLKTEQEFPKRIEISQAIQFVLHHEELKSYFQEFAGFIQQVEDIIQSFDLNVVRPQHDYLMEETKPVYFVAPGDGNLIKYDIKKFIETYNSFFLLCKEVLQFHAPRAIAIGLER
jgi:hypothetical protein